MQHKSYRFVHFTYVAALVVFHFIQTFFFPTGLIPRTHGPSNDFTLLNGWICLHGVLD